MERFYNTKNDKQSIYDIFRACRLCGAGGGYKMPIIHDINLSDIVDVEIELKRKIRECVSIEVHADDKMPPLICELCVDKVNDFYEFREMCRETNERTRARLGLPPQTLGASESDDCILGFTSPVYPSPNQQQKEPTSAEAPRASQGRGRPRKKPRESNVSVESSVSPMAVKTRRSVEKEKKVDTPPPTPPPTRASRKETRQLGILKNSKASKLSVSPQPLLKEKLRGKREAGRDRETTTKPVKRVKLQIARAVTPPAPTTRGEKRRQSRTVSPPPAKQRPSRAHAAANTASNEPFKCVLCGAGYMKRSSLSNHMVSSHSPCVLSEKMACTPCREWFASAEDAATHHRWHKNNAKFYHCTACTAEFKQLSGFNKHFTLKQCVPEHEVPDLQCGECWLTFPTTTWMDQHNCGGPDARPGGECYKCRKKFAKYKQLSKHEESCIGKGKKTTTKPDSVEQPATEETSPRVQPVQIRMQRCDKLLQRIKREPPENDTYYDVSEVKPEFGLDKSCTYPYISSVGTVRIKTEPENHDSDFITSDNIKQEIKEEVSYESDYLDTGFGDDHYSDGSENTVDQPAPRMVINPFARKQAASVEKLSTISLRTIFSVKFLGKIPLQKRKRKRKIKEQPLDDFRLEVKTETVAEEEERIAAGANSSSLFDSILDNRTEDSRLTEKSVVRDYVEKSGELHEENVEQKQQDAEKNIDNPDTSRRLEVGEGLGRDDANTESGTVEDRTESQFAQEKEDIHEKEEDGLRPYDPNREAEGKEGEIALTRDSDKSDLNGEKSETIASEIGLVGNNLEDKDIGDEVSDESGRVSIEEDLSVNKERTEGEITVPDGSNEKEADNGLSNDTLTKDLEKLNENVSIQNKEVSMDISDGRLEKEADIMKSSNDEKKLHADNDTKEVSGSNTERMEVDDAEPLNKVTEKNDEDIQQEVDDTEVLEKVTEENNEDEVNEQENEVNDSKVPVEVKMDVDIAMEELEAVLLMGSEDSKDGKVDELPLKLVSESNQGNELLMDYSSKDTEVPLVNLELKEDDDLRNLGNSVSELPEEDMDFDINSVFGGDLGPVALKSTGKIGTPKKLVVPEESKGSGFPVALKDDSLKPSGDADSEVLLESKTDKLEEDVVSFGQEDDSESDSKNDVDTITEQESDKSEDSESKPEDLGSLQNSTESGPPEEEMVLHTEEKTDETNNAQGSDYEKMDNSAPTEKCDESADLENRTEMDDISDTEYDENELLKEPEDSAKEQADSERNVLNSAEKVDRNSEHDILDLISDSGDDCNIVESPDKQTKHRGVSSNDEKSEECEGEKISLDELLLASKEVRRLPEGETVAKNDKNSMDLDSISDDEFDFDQN